MHDVTKTRAAPAMAERHELLEHLNALLDPVLIPLGLVWLALVILDLLGAGNPTVETLTFALWALFVFDFLIEIVIAPDRVGYLRSHWPTAVALLLPAFRVLAIFRSLQLLRSVRVLRTLSLARMLTSTNRALRSLRLFLANSQFAFVLGASTVVALMGAAGIYLFERKPNGEVANFGDALWWSAMMLTTMGSQFWPVSWEGRIVAWLLAVYSFVVFGYVTASLATHFLRTNERENSGGSER